MDKQLLCPWCLGFDSYVDYHNNEWGVPCTHDKKLFEFLVLESAQAGLSWATILKRREGYRKAYADFDPVIVSEFTNTHVQELLMNSAIIRNRLKIESSIHNATCFIKVQEQYGSFAQYIWHYVNNQPIQNRWKTMAEVPFRTILSDKIAKDMKQLGFKFLGSTIMYSYMQAMGLINDHLVHCPRYNEIQNKYGEKPVF